MSEAKKFNPKKLIVNHHKLGNIELGKINNPEKCLMICQLIQEKQKMTNDLRGASLLINKIPEKTREKYIEAVKKDLDEAKKKLEVTPPTQPNPSK